MNESLLQKTALSKVSIIIGTTAMLAMPTGALAQIDEVITTAQRRDQNVQDVPLAVTAFSPDDLEIKQIDEPLDLLQFVPNFYGGNNTGLGSANVYFIRGQGNTETIATFDPPVGTYVDEVYIARQNANNVSFFDVESIEVLRGPQGTLFGRNTTGGAVVTRMKKPSEEKGGYIELQYGSYDRYLGQASVDMPINESILTKLSGFYLDEEGFVDNLATGETLNGQEGFGIRGDVRFLLSDTWLWDVSGDYVEDSGANFLNYSRGGSPLTGAEGGSDRVANTGLSIESGTGTLVEQALSGKGLGVDNSSYSLTSNVQVDLDSGVVNFIAGYRSLEQDFIVDFLDGGFGGQQFPSGGFTIINEGEHNQISLELKYSNSYFDGALDLISGLYYFNEANTTDLVDLFSIDVNPGPGISPVVLNLANRTIVNDLNTYAVYTQGDYHLTDRLTFTLGARWTEEVKTVDYKDNTGGNLNTEAILNLGVATEQKKSLVTPRAVINYDWNNNISTYASATKGFKSGGWNARGTTPDQIVPFGPEKVWNYEVGLRSVLFDNTLQLNATAFLMDVDALQTPSSFIRPNGAIVFITQNFADLETKGVEADITWAPNSQLNLFASLGVQDAAYKNIPEQGLQQQADCLASPTNVGGGRGIIAPDCSVADPVRTPEYTATLGGSYEIPLGRGWSVTPAANIRFVGETFTGTSGTAAGFEDGYTLVNAGLSLQDEDKNWRAFVECKNCMDEAYITSVLAGGVYSNAPVRWNIGIRRNF